MIRTRKRAIFEFVTYRDIDSISKYFHYHNHNPRSHQNNNVQDITEFLISHYTNSK
jgi:hypothetical protein